VDFADFVQDGDATAATKTLRTGNCLTFDFNRATRKVYALEVGQVPYLINLTGKPRLAKKYSM
jgi:hypothetical protein